ncbi:MAG: PQQ-binding-like beta-propeller repeat protein [Phyllobacteriaceae bacterium]|nr:PQQ-binding-like beta-propeller repeat protein [Phyllobacteriaceae bacterium]
MSKLLRLALLATLAAPLPACSSTDDLQDAIAAVNPFGDSKTPLPGNRRDVLDQTATEVAKNRTVSIGAARSIGAWTSVGGPTGNAAGNVALSGSGATNVWSTRAGDVGSGSFLREDVRAFVGPVTTAGRAYVLDPNGNVTAVSLAGGVSWTAALRPKDRDNQSTTGGLGTDGAHVFAATAWGDVVALDADSGAKLWEKKLAEPVRSAPTVAGGKIYVVTQSNTLFALSASDGTEAWTYRGVPEAGDLLSTNSPAVVGGVVVVPFSSGELVALDEKKGQPIWNDSLATASRSYAVSGLSTIAASPVVADGVVYTTGVGGRTIASELKSGRRLWDVTLGSAHTPAVSGNAVFLVDLDNTLTALERRNGEVLWATKLPAVKAKKKRTVWAGPVLAGGTLWLASNEGAMIGVEATSGRVVSTQSGGKPVMISPIAVDGKILTLAADGTLSAWE